MAEIKKDLLIIGAGPAGLGAALYARRADIDFQITEKHMPGGQIVNTEFIENYLGSKKESGYDLIQGFVDHCKELDIEVKEYSFIASIEPVKGKDQFKCKVYDSDHTYKVSSIIMATGASPKMLNLKGEKELIGSGISFCATCDGALYRDKVVAVVGGGDTAVEEALFLAKFAKTVYIIHRRDELRAVQILQDRAFENKRIKFLWNTVVDKFVGKSKLDHIFIKNLEDKKVSRLDVDGLFEYVGYVPNSKLVKDLVELDQDGFIVTDQYMRTSRPGIYAAGDVRNTPLRQVITAVSDGAIAATVMDKHMRGLL
ncbi:MAG: FAD-dependent oxidoreductase [Actinomycetota bacterium]|nr:FAD-dependent oxidoreductase [Actinomycetota bacterium]